MTLLTRRSFLKGTGALAGNFIAEATPESYKDSRQRTAKPYQVALAQADSYERETVREKVFTIASFAQQPFLYCLNHLLLASSLGLGSNNLDDIEIVGAALEDVQTNFWPHVRG